ncbi:MAG TPA: hypothetical protein VKQ36_15705 [Ktedonobacterales bacterium]|nr:hypothetical protein [Ktedonobacterales bacterium]
MTTPPGGYQPYQGAPGQTGPQQPPEQPPEQPPQYQPYQPQSAPPYQPQGSQYPPQYAPPPQYGAPPPQYGPPPYYAPPQPQPQQRSSSRAGWITCGIIAVVLLVLCGGVGVGAYIAYGAASHAVGSASDSLEIVATVSGFCSDEQGQSYDQAYTLFSSNLQKQITAADFARNSQQLDTSKGVITVCQQQNNAAPQVSGSTATQALQVIRNSSATGNLHLVKQGNSWLINSIDSSLTLL